MQIRQVVLGRLGIIPLLVIAYEICSPPASSAQTKYDSTVYISAVKNPLPGAATCWVNSPRLRLQTNRDRVQWVSTDNQYQVRFLNLSSAPSGYTPKSPLHGGDNTVTVDKGRPSQTYDVDYDSGRNSNYYFYEIFDQNGKLCKRADDDKDTGLDVGN